MKNLTVVLLALISLSSFSSTKSIGDRVEFEISFQGKSASSETVITALNRSSQEYDVKTTTIVQGQTEVTIEKVPEEDIMTKETAAYMLENCQFMGGAIEQINLAGKHHSSCKLQVDADSVRPMLERSGLKITNKSNGFVWIGSFPINGIGKLETSELSMSLKSMSW